MGTSLGLALGKDEQDPAECAIKLIDPLDGPHWDVSAWSVLHNNDDADSEDFEDILIEEEEDIIETTSYATEIDGEKVEVKNTSEGLIEVVEPYIISEEEFMDPNLFVEFGRHTLIFYEEDDVLATDRDEVIHNVEELVGSQALTSFGHMSNNKDVVFVRNIKLGCNFEIIRENGSYQEMVLGLSMDEDSDYEKAKNFFKALDKDD